jgi:dTDP-glucose pyrophosphorylase/CBS domain-containing protein
MDVLKKIILRSDDSMKNAIKVLNNDSFSGADNTKGIVLVADEHGVLIGTITDGDIRRALISQYNLDTYLLDFMCRSPISAREGDDQKTIFNKMKSKEIFHIPILNSHGKIVSIETLHNLLENKKHDNPVFLMAGGFGTRLQPLTNKLPKPLIHVGSKPIMEIIIEQFIEFGFHNFFISTHYKAELIRNYFGDGSKWGIQIQYVFEKEPLGTAGALGLLPKNMPDLPIIMMNGDILTKVNFNQLLSYHKKNSAIATMCMREYDFQVPYGVIETKNNNVINIVEKPIHKFFINAGIYVLNPKIISKINGFDYLDMPTLIENQIKMNERVNSFPIHEYWIDIGRINQLDKANQEVSAMFNQ